MGESPPDADGGGPARPDDVIGQVYAGSYRRLVVQLYAVTGDLGEAQETVQEAFVRALLAPHRFAELDNPEAWLRRVAVNVARSRHRRRAVLARLLPRLAAPVDTERLIADSSAEHVALMRALRQLPAGQRHAIALHYLADLPVAEVADALGVTEGTVKSRLSRGRTALAGLLVDTSTSHTRSSHA
ncbi:MULTISPECIES: SigE family RNA polymerase sigma factor [unclassified Solwaraspora]|uniref:RNA polymerase sigma factor n=1 Tax=unclassified Solwaraspora TaxID=2627926 RepID=UPI00248BDE1F|nr:MULTISPECIES: SigE family RNA polymerase sigma factor [unclassified Solwaraspora]WBB99779.1 SigE family RNA polymerase sigma factor [Solwaraspora sp. WMMA2059]WBC21671.1 SigE family RNA polymerase sigma factor [Solwaraspora sp. WMMA2080]WFE20482.1 SigE family RNA polymerase sigma factor [Solwaraspora sp. WMMD937]WJK36268.1 SigE family RNA polymerase sigma factor [Solwaraspora sp. WMMA2065]